MHLLWFLFGICTFVRILAKITHEFEKRTSQFLREFWQFLGCSLKDFLVQVHMLESRKKKISDT